MGEIKAVILDWGGVLIEDPAPPRDAYCAKVLGVLEEKYKDTYQKYMPLFDTGKIDEEEFWKRVCSDLGVKTPLIKSLWREAFVKFYKEKKQVFALLHKLKNNGYKIGFLSNTEPPCMNYFYELGYDKIFDAIAFSCAQGVRKPDKRIYEAVLEKLGLRPEEAIYIDDKQKYVEGAIDVRIHGVLFMNEEQVIKELTVFGVI